VAEHPVHRRGRRPRPNDRFGFNPDVAFLQESVNQPDHRAPVYPCLPGQLGVSDLRQSACLWSLGLASPERGCKPKPRKFLISFNISLIAELDPLSKAVLTATGGWMSIPPEILEPARRQVPIACGVLNISMAGSPWCPVRRWPVGSRLHDAACAGGQETRCPPAVRRELRSFAPYEASAEPCAHSR